MNADARDSRSGSPSVSEPGNHAGRKRLEEKSLLTDEGGGTVSAPPTPDVEALRALLDEVDRQGATYQSVAVAAVQILERALRYEREAAEAALSLGQQEKMKSMVATADQAASVLRETLSAQGHKVMNLCTQQSPSDPDLNDRSSRQSWVPVLEDALNVLEEGTDQMTSLTTGQPPGSPARQLSEVVAQLLRHHHDALLLEAEEWTS